MPLPVTADGQLAPIVNTQKPKKNKPARQHWSHRRNVQGWTVGILSIGVFFWILMVLGPRFIDFVSSRWGVGSGTPILITLAVIASLLVMWLVILAFKSVKEKHPKKDLTGSTTSTPEHPLPNGH